MSSHNEKVQPLQFDTADSPVAADNSRSGPIVPPPREAPPTPSWVIPALGGLLLLALAVVFWLPGQYTPEATPPEPVAEVEPGSTTPSSSAPASEEAAAAERSPFADAQVARLRQEAQDALQALLDLQYELDEAGAQEWAPEAYAEAVALAAAADEHYRARRFDEATATYQEGTAKLEALRDAMPAILEQLLTTAEAELDAGDAEAARDAADKALLMEPDNGRALIAVARSETLPQVLELISSAAQHSSERDYESAIADLEQAAGLDGAHTEAAEALAEARQDLTRKKFNRAMSNGYIALEEDDFDEARRQFKLARKQMPDSREVTTALTEVETAETQAKLARLRRQGQGAEDEERWADAVKAYEATLAIDGSILFASEGLQRTSARARLDELMVKAIAEPSRLADDKIYTATAAVLRQAQSVTPVGPRMQRQLEQLEQIVEWARQPIAVTLRSDNATEVTVYKVARLGRFERQQLQLNPGVYTAVGVRPGYRDVRHRITVSHENPPKPVTIACTEPI